MIFSCMSRHNVVEVAMYGCLMGKGGGVDIEECGLTFNGLMAQRLNHLGEYGGCLAPRDNQDFDPYVPPPAKPYTPMHCAFEVGKQYKAIGVTKTFCFSLQVIFLFNFFCFQMIS